MNNCAIPINSCTCQNKTTRKPTFLTRNSKDSVASDLSLGLHSPQSSRANFGKRTLLFRSVQTKSIQLWAGLCCNEQNKIITSMYLLGDINARGIRVDTRVSDEYERLRSQKFEDNAPNTGCPKKSTQV